MGATASDVRSCGTASSRTGATIAADGGPGAKGSAPRPIRSGGRVAARLRKRRHGRCPRDAPASSACSFVASVLERSDRISLDAERVQRGYDAA